MGENQKRKTKIGLSLFIALIFCLSSVSLDSFAGDPSGISIGLSQSSPTYEIIRLRQKITAQSPPGMVTIAGVSLGDIPIHSTATNHIATGLYPIYVDVFNDYTENASVIVFCEMYRKNYVDHKETLLYETSFENDFDVYNNWTQIDIDKGTPPEGNGSFFDTWTWSDKKACTGKHSFKCTMYDSYKGNQDDYLVCTRRFDLSDQYKINVSFNIWVKGQGEYLNSPPGNNETGYIIYTVFDYLSFEVGDHTGNWFNPTDNMVFRGPDWNILEGSYYFHNTSVNVYTYAPCTNYHPKARNLGGGWWHVWYEAEVAELLDMALDVEDIMFRFHWTSDPQFQYEGAYVDDFKVVSIEEEYTKVLQTHTQSRVDIPPCDVSKPKPYRVELPLQFNASYIGDNKETRYEMIVWMEVVDSPAFWTPHDWTYPEWWTKEGNDPDDYPGPVNYYLYVADYYDVAIESIGIESKWGLGETWQDKTIVMQGDNIRVTSQVHIKGTVPGYDIPIKAYAQKETWETIFHTDCESMEDWPMNDGFVHIADIDSWSGAKCLGFFDDIDNEYPVGAFSYVLGPIVDFAEYEEVIMDFYTRFNTQYNHDYVRPCLLDPYAGFICSALPHITGYSSGWIGPMQPGGLYQSCDLKAAYEYFVSIGLFRNGDGEVFTEVTVGFYMWSDEMYYGDFRDNHHFVQQSGWSGVLIDAVTIKGEKLSDVVWQDVDVVAGPAEPSEIYEVRFRWENVPYSNYKITVECIDEKACGNWKQGSLSKCILVVSQKEKAHPKEIEFIDQSGSETGRWGICSSDTDWYMSTNPESRFYPRDAKYYAALCPNNNVCIDASEYFKDGVPTNVTLNFEAWWDLHYYSGDKVIIQIANCIDGVPPDKMKDWTTVGIWCPSGYIGDMFTHSSEEIFGDEFLPDGWVPISINLLDEYPTLSGTFALRFVMISNNDSFQLRGFLMDSLSITIDDKLFYGPDEMNTDENWCFDYLQYGTFWEYIDDVGWCASWPTGIPFDDKMIWYTEIMDCYEAYLTINHTNYFPHNWTYDEQQDDWIYHGRSIGYIEISVDGENWYELGEYVPPNPYASPYGGGVEHFVLTPWFGESIQIRFRAKTEGMALPGGFWCIYDIIITAKGDHTPPVSKVEMSGTMEDSGWYSTPVKITITATDDAAGVKEIHYVLDGVETVVAGDNAQFTVSDNGYHNLQYWAVDKIGNEEQQKSRPTFKIDTNTPSISITAPTPGLYLFGKKILDINKPIIISVFTIEAQANDAESGIYRVQFYLNDDIIGEDTHPPFNIYCKVRHMGDATVKVVAEDFAKNTAEDTLDIKYYRFL